MFEGQAYVGTARVVASRLALRGSPHKKTPRSAWQIAVLGFRAASQPNARQARSSHWRFE
ncbi:hypothetical protein PFUM301597_16880 [Pseudomonas fluorescens]